MNGSEERELEVRRSAAREERRVILAIVERHLRLQAHGHGADGASVLQHLLAELEERDRREDRDGG